MTVPQPPFRCPMIARYVPFDAIEVYLARGWMLAIPNMPHAVLDSYRVMMIYLCNCEDNT